MPLLSTLPLQAEIVLISLLSCVAVGLFFSAPAVWRLVVPSNISPKDIYIKAGEYGEAAGYPHFWSPFKEPLNAWTSLAYSFVGCIIVGVGLNDCRSSPVNDNRMSKDFLFSCLYGASCIYLGLASFLFHASHLEVWRKVDAGMTTGSLAAPLVFGIWDRIPPPSLNAYWMVLLAVTLQLSFTHGYLPYGSSDVLVPSIIIFFYVLELHPRYGGVVDSDQWKYWLFSIYGVICSFLLRLADVKQKNPSMFALLLRICIGLSVVFMAYLGPSDIIIPLIFTLFAIVVWRNPSKGHIFWHIGSAYSLYIWWYMMRLRPGNPLPPAPGSEVPDLSLFTIVFMAVIKNAVRRIFINFPSSLFPSQAHKDRVFFLVEHAFFMWWGWQVMVVQPERESEGSSWLLKPVLCWFPPSYPSEGFRLYYLAKVGTSIEDVVYLVKTKIYPAVEDPLLPTSAAENAVETRARKPDRDVAMDIHHAATAILTTTSCYFGYTRIGSLVMFLHDASDISLDLVRLFGLWQLKTLQICSYVATLATWAYWRLYWFPAAVLYSIYNDGKSFNYDSPCKVGECSAGDMPERWPFLVVLGTLLVLHIFWYALMLKKGVAELVPSFAT